MEAVLSTKQIGVITAIGPFASLLLQTAWGRLADRTNRKFVLMLALATSGLSALLYLLGTSYPYILGVSTLFVLVNMSVLPMSDAMALEFCTNNRFHFAPVRMCGTIGYAIMPVLLGGLFSVHLHYIFPAYCALCLIAATGTCFFPKSIAKPPVRASKSSEVRILPLLRDPFVIFLLTANFVISIGICAYTYLPLYASNMGYDNNLCGLLNAVAAMSEIPSLLLIDRVLKKIKGQTVIIASSFFCGLRLLITYLAGFCGSNAIWVMMLGQLLQSVSYITNYYCSAQLIHERFPAELKSTAQTLLAMITAGFSRIVGAVLGGILSEPEVLGLQNTFLFFACFLFIGSFAVLACYRFAVRRGAAH